MLPQPWKIVSIGRGLIIIPGLNRIFNEVIVIRKEIGDKKREASFYGNLGDVFASVSECARKLDNSFKKQLTSERKLETKTEKEQI